MPTECRDPHLVQRRVESTCYLEYGTGGSTIQAALIGVSNIVGIGSDAMWHVGIHSEVAGGRGQLRALCFMSISVRQSHLAPNGRKGVEEFPDPCPGALKVLQKSGLRPDTILVDGRFRAACGLATLLFAAAGSPHVDGRLRRAEKTTM